MRASDKNLTFEDALEELESITRKLEEGKEPLEESMNLYDRGMFLKGFCEKRLKEAEGKWSILRKKTDSSYEEEELSGNKPQAAEQADSNDGSELF